LAYADLAAITLSSDFFSGVSTLSSPGSEASLEVKVAAGPAYGDSSKCPSFRTLKKFNIYLRNKCAQLET
jgi:hypothetical protein